MNTLVKVQKGIMIISSILILIGLFLSVCLRYVLKMDLFGIEELLLIPIFLLYFIGAAQGSYEKSHITADIIDSYIKSQKIRAWNRLVTSLVTLIVCLVISFWNTQYLVWSFSNGGTTPGYQIPLYIPHGTVLLGFSLMSLYSFVDFLHQIGIVRDEMKKGKANNRLKTNAESKSTI
ncbi:TRAP transporter small permease [Metabacillus litoralis]|uniref:TRAP transporter small permease n=1 Tax=Metabacillus litoralis TaxID=152268 RepID=UPI00203FA971|nr:TRAP transporter small permease [Metabacillus litoralis]MCM3411843.1 TRAP transporter small permease [Metabacillus litoralis]